jgi:hypothetical protein
VYDLSIWFNTDSMETFESLFPEVLVDFLDATLWASYDILEDIVNLLTRPLTLVDALFRNHGTVITISPLPGLWHGLMGSIFLLVIAIGFRVILGACPHWIWFHRGVGLMFLLDSVLQLQVLVPHSLKLSDYPTSKTMIFPFLVFPISLWLLAGDAMFQAFIQALRRCCFHLELRYSLLSLASWMCCMARREHLLWGVGVAAVALSPLCIMHGLGWLVGRLMGLLSQSIRACKARMQRYVFDTDEENHGFHICFLFFIVKLYDRIQGAYTYVKQRFESDIATVTSIIVSIALHDIDTCTQTCFSHIYICQQLGDFFLILFSCV